MSHHLNGRFLHRLHDKWREIERVVTDRRNREFTPRPVQAGRVGIIFRRPSTFYRDCIQENGKIVRRLCHWPSRVHVMRHRDNAVLWYETYSRFHGVQCSSAGGTDQ
jgi:hypothetical protein